MARLKADIAKNQYKENAHIKDFAKNVISVSEEKNLDFRLQTDSFVAYNIFSAIVPFGKMLVDYGGAHTMRQNTDIDASLTKMGIKTKSNRCSWQHKRLYLFI